MEARDVLGIVTVTQGQQRAVFPLDEIAHERNHLAEALNHKVSLLLCLDLSSGVRK
jgi:hypothetical protein